MDKVYRFLGVIIVIEITNMPSCTGCTSCVNACPKGAISMIENEQGFKEPKIDSSRCIDCGLCKKVCPLNKEIYRREEVQEAYACYSKNEEERLNSSSGGLFSLIAKSILKDGRSCFWRFIY